MLALAGFDRAEQRAEAVMALETAIARSQATREASANDRNADNLWTRADFAREARAWTGPCSSRRRGWRSRRRSSSGSPRAVKGVAALVASQPLEAWKDYLRFHAVHDYADVLPRAFAEQALALRAATASAAARARERALEATQSAMGDAIGRMYAERYFPAEQKARVRRIVGNVIAAFRKRVEAATWMSPASRALALAKLEGAVLRRRLSGAMAGLFRPRRRPARRRGQPAARRRPRTTAVPWPDSASPWT